MKNQVISISEVVAAVRQGGHIRRVFLKNAKRYAVNASGQMEWAATLFEAKHIRRQPGDEVLKVGNKFANISELVRTLRTLKGKGEAFLQIGTRIFYGKVEE